MRLKRPPEADASAVRAPAPSSGSRGPLLLIVAVAAVLRLAALGWLPSPAGDEGNWALLALKTARGEAAGLAPDAAFVSPLFAYLGALCVRVFGPEFVAIRLPGALAMVAAVAATGILVGRLAGRRAALAAAAIVALHPWTVAWSRTAAVPYQLAFATMLVGPLVVLEGLRQRSGWLVALGIQVVALGAHFSPLTACAAAVTAAVLLNRANRWSWRRWEVWASLAVAAAHTVPVVRGALDVVAVLRMSGARASLGTRLGEYAHLVGTGLAGEATVRHFCDLALAPWPAVVTAVPVIALVLAGSRMAARPQGGLARFGALYLTLSLVLTPLVLAPGRGWDLRFTHQERYLFSVLPGFVLLAAAAADLGSQGRRLAGFFVLLVLPLATGRIGWRLFCGGGTDTGPLVFAGEHGYRGWLVSSRARPTLNDVRDAVLRDAGPDGATLLIADDALYPLHFAVDQTPIEVVDARGGLPPRPDGRYYYAVFSADVLPERTGPPREAMAQNAALRSRMERGFGRRYLILQLRQRNGSGLIEVWRAEDPAARLRHGGIGAASRKTSRRQNRDRDNEAARGEPPIRLRRLPCGPCGSTVLQRPLMVGLPTLLHARTPVGPATAPVLP